MELRHIRYFCAVAAHQSFTRAAGVLHVSQSAISEQISDLEREIGVPLLVRGQAGVKLSRHGQIFLDEARKILAAAERATELAQRSLRGEIGTLNIGFFSSGTGKFVPAIIRDFRRAYPGVRVSLAETSASKQAEALMNGTLDVGFTRPLDPPFDTHLLSEPLYEDFLMAVLPKDHPKARAPFDLRELAEERFLLIARETAPALFDKIIAVCSEAGFSPTTEATGSA